MEFTYQGLVRHGFGFYNPNHAAAAMAMALPFLWWARRALAARGLAAGAWRRWALAAGATALELALYAGLAFTYSRSGALALMTAATAWWLAARRPDDQTTRPWRRWRRAGVAVAALALALAIGAAGRLADGGARATAAAAGRLTAARAGLAMLADNPGGVGAGNSGRVATLYYVDDGREFRTLVNSFLTFAAERGAAAGAALLWLGLGAFGGLALAALREKRAGGGHAAAALLAALTAATVVGTFSTCFDWNCVAAVAAGRRVLGQPNDWLQAALALAAAGLALAGAAVATRCAWRRGARAAVALWAAALAGALALTGGALLAGRHWASARPGAAVRLCAGETWAFAPLRPNAPEAPDVTNAHDAQNGAGAGTGKDAGGARLPRAVVMVSDVARDDPAAWWFARRRFARHAFPLRLSPGPGSIARAVAAAARRLTEATGAPPAVMLCGAEALRPEGLPQGAPLVLWRPGGGPEAVAAALAASGDGPRRALAVVLSPWDPDGDNYLWEQAYPVRVLLAE